MKGNPFDSVEKVPPLVVSTLALKWEAKGANRHAHESLSQHQQLLMLLVDFLHRDRVAVYIELLVLMGLAPYGAPPKSSRTRTPFEEIGPPNFSYSPHSR